MKIPAINQITPFTIKKTRQYFKNSIDTFSSSLFSEDILRRRGILNTDINTFFSNISNQLFEDKTKQQAFCNYLKNGYISLSSSCYTDLKHPESAIAISLNASDSIAKKITILDEFINSGVGVGVNFSTSNNPTKEIKQLNHYFKYKENKVKRPPAGIALLNIDNPNILDFIKLKNNEDFKNWCFDLSVVIDDNFLQKLNSNDESSKKIYNELLNSMLKTGEPGITFSNNKNFICDSCACSELKQNEKLILGHVNLSKFNKNNKIDTAELNNASKLLAEAMKKINLNSRIGILGYQDLLNKLNIKYGSYEGNKILTDCLKIISNQAKAQNIKTAISPTGTTSRLLKTTPSIEPVNQFNLCYADEIKTMSMAQKYLDGGISKTINLKNNATIEDINSIILQSKLLGLKGITVYPQNH